MKKYLDIGALAIQNLLTIFFSTILVPVLINNVCGENVISIPVTLFATGIGTIAYIIGTKGKLANQLIASTSFIVPTITIFATRGLINVYSCIMISGFIYIILAFILKITKEQVLKIFTPSLTGALLIVIGMMNVPNAISYTSLVAPSIELRKLFITGVTLLTIIILGNEKKYQHYALLSGAVIGYITAYFLGEVDLSILKTAEWIKRPNFILPGIDYTFNYQSFLMILPVTLISCVHHIALHQALEISIKKNRPLYETLFAHGLANILSGFFSGPALEVSSEYVGATGITKKSSTAPIIVTSIIFMVLSCFNKGIIFLNTIPQEVIGAILLVLCAVVIVLGIKIIFKDDLNCFKNVAIVGIMLVIGLGGTSLSYTKNDITISLNSISASFTAGLILNLFLKRK